MKKLLVSIVICLSLILTACGSKVDEGVAKKYYDVGETIVLALNEGNYKEVTSHFNATMKAQLTEEQLAQIEPILVASGEYEKISKQSIEEKDNVKLIVFIVDYSKEKRVFTISFDENNEVAGLFIQ